MACERRDSCTPTLAATQRALRPWILKVSLNPVARNWADSFMESLYLHTETLSSNFAIMRRQEFSTWFKRHLRTNDWTQADFARKTGIATGTISNWARGYRVPDPPSCDLIADILGIDRDKVLALAGHRPLDLELAPDDPRRDLKALIDRVAWDEERVDTVRGMLGRWYDHDQNKKRKKGTL
jgi:transcriptional regulator with XRE-family HTH domain